MTYERPVETAPVCYRHPNRTTYLACSQCGRPICAECSIDAAVGQRCPECVRVVGTQKTVDVRRGWGTTGRGAPMTTGIVAVTVAVFLFTFALPGVGHGLVDLLAMDNRWVAAGQWWRMVTVVLLHANFMHILFNMWALWVLGPQIEREAGSVRFLALYLGAATVGSAFAFFLGSPNDVGVGASGAIFGLFGVWLAGAVRHRRTAYGRYLLSQLLFLLAINAALPLLIQTISWQAHLGGLIAGYVVGDLWARMGRGRATAAYLAVPAALAAVAVLSVALG